MRDEGNAEYGLVMPFVVVHSKGGLFEDNAFVAGYTCGLADKTLAGAAANGATVVTLPMVPEALVPQIDLIALRHGFRQPVPTATAEGWVFLTIERDE